MGNGEGPGVAGEVSMGNGEGPGVAGEVWAMVTWSGWRGVGNGDLEWLERCGQW